GLCRPNGIAVAAAVCCAAAVVLWKDRRARRNWRVWTGAALSPVGWLGYVAWVGAREGSPLGYFAVQRGWGSRFDFGYDAFMFIRHLVIGLSRLGYYVTFALIVAALLALVFLSLIH
ncbi:membrane protein, partial [Streptomyces varsoviensis]